MLNQAQGFLEQQKRAVLFREPKAREKGNLSEKSGTSSSRIKRPKALRKKAGIQLRTAKRKNKREEGQRPHQEVVLV